MVNLLKWIAPDTGFGFTYTRIERGPSSTGPFTEVTSSDVTGYTASGLAFPATEAKDENGTTGSWYQIRFFDGTGFSDYSAPMQAFSFRGYCTIDEVRAFTNIQATEYSDMQLQLIIDGVTSIIDLETGRTWQGIQTFNPLYIDGSTLASRTNFLDLHRGDIQTITSINVDTSGDGSYSQVIDPSLDVFVYKDAGYLHLNPNAPIHTWPPRYQCVKLVMTAGNAQPSNDIRHLALLMVANHISVDHSRSALIKRILDMNRRATFDTV